MDEYIKQLKGTFENELFYFTLIGCMTLIDTCSALNSQDGETNKKRFKEWYKKYMNKYHNLHEAICFDADECYKLRCRLLHQGQSKIDTDNLDRNIKSGVIAFRIPPGTIHRCNLERVYYIDIEIFMSDLIEAVEEWLEETSKTDYVESNLRNMIKITTTPPGNSKRSGTYIY